MSLPAALIHEAVARALAEDLGLAGDVTSAACIPPEAQARARIVSRATGVISGTGLAAAAFAQVDPRIAVTTSIGDGGRVSSGAVVLSVSGPARGILAAERTALNFLGRLSGVATATAALVAAVAGTNARIVCTRKTTPGLRAFEKYAVRCGGGANHRFGLFDAILIKDNHVAAAGGVGPAVRAARAAAGHMVRVEVEVDGLDGLDEALAAGADLVLLDNMPVASLAEAVRRAAGRARLEASGNVSLATVRAIAETGVDMISSGAITHSAPCLDLGLDFD